MNTGLALTPGAGRGAGRGRWTNAITTGCIAAAVVLQPAVVAAATVKISSAYLTRSMMDEIKPQFEKATGHKLETRFGHTRLIVKRIRRGDIPDVVLTNQDGIRELQKDGKVHVASATVIFRSGIGVAVRKGSPKPDISSPEALKRTLLAAKSITYNNPAYGGSSAVYFAKVLERLGIAREMQPKTVFSSSDAGSLVASGKVELGIAQVSSLMRFKGVEIVGPLPGELQSHVVYSAAILTEARNADTARSLISFLRGPEAAGIFRSKGMEPG